MCTKSPRIKKIPVKFNYYCECKEELSPINNYCPRCGKKLNWDNSNIDLDMSDPSAMLSELFTQSFFK